MLHWGIVHAQVYWTPHSCLLSPAQALVEPLSGPSLLELLEVEDA